MLNNPFYQIFRKALPQQPDCGSAFESCEDLPFYNWVKITVSKDLKYLLKSGTVPVDKLQEIWLTINDEYRVLIKDIDGNYAFNLKKEIETLDRDQVVILAIVNQLRVRRNDELISILKNYYNFPLNYVDLNTDLDKTLLRLKSRLVNIKLKQNEFERINEAKAESAVTEQDFIEQLAVLSQFQTYYLNWKQLTVAEYAGIYTRFKAMVEIRLANA